MNEKEKINSDVKYELLDVSGKWLGAIGASIITAGIILPFVLWGVYAHFERTAANGAPIPESASRQRFELPAAPQLKLDPVKNYQDFRALENEKLNKYGWVNREQGVVHIPIEQAMKTLVQTGLPAVSASNQAVIKADSDQTPSNSPAAHENRRQK